MVICIFYVPALVGRGFCQETVYISASVEDPYYCYEMVRPLCVYPIGIGWN